MPAILIRLPIVSVVILEIRLDLLQQLASIGFGEMKVSTCLCSHTRKLAA